MGGPEPTSHLPAHRAGGASPGWEGHAGGSTQQCRLHCLSSVLDPQEEWSLVLNGRPQQMDPVRGPGQDVGVRGIAHLATGLGPHCSRIARPPGRALQLLTCDGVGDSADTAGLNGPAVLARLRELHPQADGPRLVVRPHCQKISPTSHPRRHQTSSSPWKQWYGLSLRAV